MFSPFSPAECVSRLREEIDKGAMVYLFGFGSKPFVGRVSESSFSLRRRIMYRNSFQTVLRARMRPERGGTVISGTCGMHPLVKGFMLIWFGGVILIGGTVFWTTIWRVLSGNSRGTQDAVVGECRPSGHVRFWRGSFVVWPLPLPRRFTGPHELPCQETGCSYHQTHLAHYQTSGPSYAGQLSHRLSQGPEKDGCRTAGTCKAT